MNKIDECSFSLLVPAHNEAKDLQNNISLLMSYVSGFSDNFDVLIVENGSIDQTLEIVKELAGTYQNVSFLHMEQASLGLALSKGIRNAKGDSVIFVPVDLSVKLDFINRSLGLLEKYDIVVGSKRLGDATDDRPFVRKVTSIFYHLMTRLLLGVKITDTTCVKAFKKSKVLPLMSNLRFRCIFETELLVKAQRMNCKIAEIPVSVSDKRLPRENLLLKILRKSRDIVRLKLALMLGVE